MKRPKAKAAFTLVELLVVVAIIAVLIGIALPSFTGVRRQAKERATKAAITAIETGLEQYRAERPLGGTLPPSASDRTDRKILDPIDDSGEYVNITGASLAAYALAGPDKGGTAGFRPEGASQYWADSTGGYGSGGLYDPSRNPPAPRYGPFAGSNLMDRMQALGDMTSFKLPASYPAHELEQKAFMDEFGGAILYYRARPAARRMIYRDGSPPQVGVYDQRDNYLLTNADSRHVIKDTLYDGDNCFGRYEPNGSCSQPRFDSFILDKKASNFAAGGEVLRGVPVRAKDFLLISAGTDGRYGNEDDVVNWSR